jgi:hypothetical protein
MSANTYINICIYSVSKKSNPVCALGRKRGCFRSALALNPDSGTAELAAKTRLLFSMDPTPTINARAADLFSCSMHNRVLVLSLPQPAWLRLISSGACEADESWWPHVTWM